jgi:hypothetical protein
VATDAARHNGRPQDFAATKVDAPLEECAFLLDFSRPLRLSRWLGFWNRHIGIALFAAVSIVHRGEDEGGYAFGLWRSQPYFTDILKLWKQHYPAKRVMVEMEQRANGLQVIADFARHFPEDAQPPKA